MIRKHKRIYPKRLHWCADCMSDIQEDGTCNCPIYKK